MRKTWNEYFLGVAKEVSTRSTCPKRQVGCVIVDFNNNILSTGYNGSPSATAHCAEIGCMINETGNCIRTIHAEQNAIARLNYMVKPHKIYCTDEPCLGCLKLIIASGIQNVLYTYPYPDPQREVFLFDYLDQVRMSYCRFNGDIS